MIKNILATGMLTLILSPIAFAVTTGKVSNNVISAAPIAADSADKLAISGTYICYGHDMHDGGYQNTLLTLTLDAKDSDFANNYGAYHFKLNDPDGDIYLGEVAASGNSAAVYFANTNPKEPNDHGVGIAVITHDKDSTNKATTVLHKFYYEPTYKGGGNGSETCVKQS